MYLKYKIQNTFMYLVFKKYFTKYKMAQWQIIFSNTMSSDTVTADVQ